MSKCPKCDVHASAWRIWLLTIHRTYRCENCRDSSRIPRGELTRLRFGLIVPVTSAIGVAAAAYGGRRLEVWVAVLCAIALSLLVAAVITFVMKQRCRLVAVGEPAPL